tara:strand:+ start:1016 stop:2146 length:1131 start_codon:yes stop_codon:yes gene_type:complete
MEVERILKDFKIRILGVILLILTCFPNIALPEDFALSKIALLSKPWGLSFINESELLVTERTGKIKIVNIYNGEVLEIQHNLNFKNKGQGGLLDIIYKDNQVWISYTEKIGFLKYGTSVAKGKFSRKEMIFNNIFQQNSASSSGAHFGGRLLIKDQHLFVSIGERGLGEIAQDPKKHPGSIIRINLDGTIPKNNPHFVDKPNWKPEIFQIGVRNPQGIAKSINGEKIYISNHGARGGDWIGLVKKGENYGWNILGWGGVNYNGSEIGPKWKPGFTKAIKYWTPSIGVSAIKFYSGEEFQEWNGKMLVASLRGMSLSIIDGLEDADPNEEMIFTNRINRIRDIEVDPKNGKIYLLGEKYFSEDGPQDDGLWVLEKKK